MRRHLAQNSGTLGVDALEVPSLLIPLVQLRRHLLQLRQVDLEERLRTATTLEVGYLSRVSFNMKMPCRLLSHLPSTTG